MKMTMNLEHEPKKEDNCKKENKPKTDLKVNITLKKKTSGHGVEYPTKLYY